jgi:hypothetical protein
VRSPTPNHTPAEQAVLDECVEILLQQKVDLKAHKQAALVAEAKDSLGDPPAQLTREEVLAAVLALPKHSAHSVVLNLPELNSKMRTFKTRMLMFELGLTTDKPVPDTHKPRTREKKEAKREWDSPGGGNARPSIRPPKRGKTVDYQENDDDEVCVCVIYVYIHVSISISNAHIIYLNIYKYIYKHL